MVHNEPRIVKTFAQYLFTLFMIHYSLRTIDYPLFFLTEILPV